MLLTAALWLESGPCRGRRGQEGQEGAGGVSAPGQGWPQSRQVWDTARPQLGQVTEPLLDDKPWAVRSDHSWQWSVA